MTQTEKVKAYLEEHGSITPIEALRRLRVFRLAARVHELRAEGVPIETRTTRRRTEEGEIISFAKYELEVAS